MEKRWFRIVFVALVMYTISFIDRTNVSLALPVMSRDLHMDPAQAGSATGIFFWGYMVLQIPAGYIAARWSAKWLVSVLLVVWGACAAGTGLVRTGHEFAWMRFALGLAEGGVAPAALVLLTRWFSRAERARANAYWFLCLPVALVVSSPLSGWILSRWNWRVLLTTEGALPFLWLLVWLTVSDHPRQARWLSTADGDSIEQTLAREAAELSPVRPEPYLQTFFRPQIALLVAVYFLLNCGAYGFLFWLPSAIGSARQLSGERVGLLFALPFVVAAIAMVLNARHSDRRRERPAHAAAALAVGGVSLAAAVLASGHSSLLSFAFLCLVGAGPWAALGPFWAIPAETLPPSVVGSAIGLVNGFGNLGGYAGPLLVGYLNKQTGNFLYAFGLLSVGLIAAAALSLALRDSRSTRS